MATIFIYRGPALLGSNLLWLRKQFTNPGIVKLLERERNKILSFIGWVENWVLMSFFKSIKCMLLNLDSKTNKLPK